MPINSIIVDLESDSKTLTTSVTLINETFSNSSPSEGTKNCRFSTFSYPVSQNLQENYRFSSQKVYTDSTEFEEHIRKPRRLLRQLASSQSSHKTNRKQKASKRINKQNTIFNN